MKLMHRNMLAVATLALLSATTFGQTGGQIIYELPSQYQKITVLDLPNGMRQMIFDAKWDGYDAVQTEMNKAATTELTLPYSRHMVASMALVEKPRRVLIVGLGGGSLQRYLHDVMPETRIETFELDPVVLAIAQKYFTFKEDARQAVAIGDGRKLLEKSQDKYDVIMLDAFSATSIPYALSTREFLEICKDHLAEGGLVAANLWDAQANFGDLMKTYDAVFPEWHVVRATGSFNAILTALPVKREWTAEKWMTAADAYEKTYKTKLGLSRMIDVGFEPMPRIPTTARVLLDKDAPKEK